MAPKLPKGFGAATTSSKENPDSSSKLTKARPLPVNKGDAKKMVEEKDPKKRGQGELNETQTSSLKRQKLEGAPSYVEAQLGPLAAPFIMDKDVKSSKAMNLEEENKAMIQALAQLLVQALGRTDKIREERARLGKLAVGKDKLVMQLLDVEAKHKKECVAKDADNSFLRQEVKDHAEMLKNLGDIIDS